MKFVKLYPKEIKHICRCTQFMRANDRAHTPTNTIGSL